MEENWMKMSRKMIAAVALALVMALGGMAWPAAYAEEPTSRTFFKYIDYFCKV